MMKNITLFAALAMLVAIMLLVGCGSQDASAPTTQHSTVSTTAPATEPTVTTGTATETTATTESAVTNVEVMMYYLPELGTNNEEILEQYLTNIRNEKTLTSMEQEFLVENGFSWITEATDRWNDWGVEYVCDEGKTIYFNPQLYTKDSGILMLYTRENGSIGIKQIAIIDGGRMANHYIYRNIHVEDGVTEEEGIFTHLYYALTYSKRTGVVTKWVLGESTEKYNVPEDSVYAGLSSVEGFIFRNGEDVYSLRVKQGHYVVVPIAHGVEEVITADYKLSSDFWSQPLFLMKDGSLKSYICGDDEEETDATRRLHNISYEGGYDKGSNEYIHAEDAR